MCRSDTRKGCKIVKISSWKKFGLVRELVIYNSYINDVVVNDDDDDDDDIVVDDDDDDDDDDDNDDDNESVAGNDDPSRPPWSLQYW